MSYWDIAKAVLSGTRGGVLLEGDNQHLLSCPDFKSLIADLGGIKVIYCDPPFAVGEDFSMKLEVKLSNKEAPKLRWSEFAYSDKWSSLELTFLTMLRSRLALMYELLADDGWLFLHCDWRTNAHVRLLLDDIFGVDNFQNEIIWSYKSGGATQRRFARKHDTIFLYSKSTRSKFYPLTEKSYNRGLKAYRFKGVTEYQDEVGWYTLVTMRDVWQIDMVGRTAKERVNYPTQKPEKLLERIINSTSQEGDLIADFFCGSGTTLAVAEQLGRRWIGADAGSRAISTSWKRLLKLRSVSAPQTEATCSKIWRGVCPVVDLSLREQNLNNYLKEYAYEAVVASKLHGRRGASYVAFCFGEVSLTQLKELESAASAVGATSLRICAFSFHRDLLQGYCASKAALMHEFQIIPSAFDNRVFRKGELNFSWLHRGKYIAKPDGDTVTLALVGFEQVGVVADPRSRSETAPFLQTGLLCQDLEGSACAISKEWRDSIDYCLVEMLDVNQSRTIEVVNGFKTAAYDRQMWEQGLVLLFAVDVFGVAWACVSV